MIGKTLAHFRVVDKLGEGGMGEVYRAEDSKLGREVALKVLPSIFADDAERMARFTREAQVLASLNHPNIAGIHQVEHEDGLQFLVMELVEGETLAERIQRGPIPVEDALEISQQVIAGLEEAHDHGIVHRDLKPANIKITPKGQVKVLDFGLAKALEDDPTTSGSGPAVTQSPTLTAQMTGAGMLLGTAAYMAPEQARGQVADRRADIWAFGIVLMEMLTGKTVFSAETVSDTLAGVLAREPQWDELPKSTPGQIRHLLERCLAKDSHNRLQAIGEARILIDRFLENPEEAEITAAEAVAPAPLPTWKRLAPWLVAAALAIALGAAILGGLGGGPEPQVEPIRASVELPEAKALHRGYGSPVALSNDGDWIVQTFAEGNDFELVVRALDQWMGSVLAAGEGLGRPYQPFFSPDGNWVGFVTPNSVQKVPISGGTPIKLCDANLSRGATWGPEDTIVFAPSPESGLSTVPAAGGEPQTLTELDSEKNESSHRWPQFLPGGEQILFTVQSASSDFDSASIEILDLASGARQLVHQGGTYGRYVESGHIIYMNQGTLFAIPFDVENLQATGSAAPVVQDVGSSIEGGAFYDVSTTGLLAYVSGEGAMGAKLTAVWIDRQGKIEPLISEERDFRDPRFSPDGRFLAVAIDTDGNSDIWVYDLERDVPTRLTFDEADDNSAVWSPDSQFIAFSSDRGQGPPSIYRIPADGSGEPERMADNDRPIFVWSWSPDGTRLGIIQQSPDTIADLAFLSVETGEVEPFLATPFVEYGPVFSPDGRYVAYGSNESGEWEVYVRPANGSRGKWQISAGGGASSPIWSADGREIFLALDGSRVQTVSVDTSGGRFQVSRPEDLFSGPFIELTGRYDMYDATPDGQRFVVFQGEAAAPEGHQHVRLITNWFTELDRTFNR